MVVLDFTLICTLINLTQTICAQLPCDYFGLKADTETFLISGQKLCKIFSEISLNSKDFDEIFEKSMPWIAYPKYKDKPEKKRMPVSVREFII